MSLWHLTKRTAKLAIACYVAYNVAVGCNHYLFSAEAKGVIDEKVEEAITKWGAARINGERYLRPPWEVEGQTKHYQIIQNKEWENKSTNR